MTDLGTPAATSAASPPRSTPSARPPAPGSPACSTSCSPAASASSCSRRSSTTSWACWASGEPSVRAASAARHGRARDRRSRCCWPSPSAWSGCWPWPRPRCGSSTRPARPPGPPPAATAATRRSAGADAVAPRVAGSTVAVGGRPGAGRRRRPGSRVPAASSTSCRGSPCGSTPWPPRRARDRDRRASRGGCRDAARVSRWRACCCSSAPRWGRWRAMVLAHRSGPGGRRPRGAGGRGRRGRGRRRLRGGAPAWPGQRRHARRCAVAGADVTVAVRVPGPTGWVSGPTSTARRGAGAGAAVGARVRSGRRVGLAALASSPCRASPSSSLELLALAAVPQDRLVPHLRMRVAPQDRRARGDADRGRCRHALTSNAEERRRALAAEDRRTRSPSAPSEDRGAARGRNMAASTHVAASRASSSATAPALSRGLFWLPHLGDWMQDGQPSSHAHEAMRLAGGGQPLAGGAGSRARRSRPRRGGRRGRTRSAGRCRRAGPSTRRRCPSGRRSRRAAAARSSSARPRGPRPARSIAARPLSSRTWSGTVHHTAVVRRVRLGQVERLLGERPRRRAGGA